MKRGKTHRSPLTDLQRLARRVQGYRLPSGPFDYAARARAAEEAEKFFHEIVRAGRSHYADPGAKAIIEAARRLYERAWYMAYPPSFWEDYQRLRSGDPAGMESAVSFLEADPWFFRSGYIKSQLIRYIKRPMLTEEYARRLQQVVLALVDRRDDRDFRAFCRLARKVDAPAQREQLTRRLTHDDPDIRRRARWVLEVLEALGEKAEPQIETQG